MDIQIEAHQGRLLDALGACLRPLLSWEHFPQLLYQLCVSHYYHYIGPALSAVQYCGKGLYFAYAYRGVIPRYVKAKYESERNHSRPVHNPSTQFYQLGLLSR